MSIPIIGPILGLIETAVDKAFPDANQAQEIKSKLTSQLLSIQSKELDSATNVIVAEASGDSWLQRNWRPLVMMWFAGLVGAHWMGFTPENLSEATVLELLEIVKVGIGGYVVGRSAEKVMKEYKK